MFRRETTRGISKADPKEETGRSPSFSSSEAKEES
jgi:hypothetical protein